MDAPTFDFVSALSAEEHCPVCEEPHAAVDQRTCSVCGTAMCPDCASLRPSTSWVCAPCVTSVPERVFVRPLPGALRTAQAAFWVWLARSWSAAVAQGSLALQAHAARVLASWRRDRVAVEQVLEHAFELLAQRLRFGLAGRGSALRGMPLREQAAGFLVGTALMIAVARAGRRDFP